MGWLNMFVVILIGLTWWFPDSSMSSPVSLSKLLEYVSVDDAISFDDSESLIGLSLLKVVLVIVVISN